MQLPEDYVPIARSCPYWELVGPFYQKAWDGGYYIGARVEEKHRNLQGVAQGGFIATLADVALGYNLAHGESRMMPVATVNLTTDFVSTAQVSDWLEARVDIQRIGATLAFANSYIHVGERLIARISGVFSISRLTASSG